jgi:hypothetical protein
MHSGGSNYSCEVGLFGIHVVDSEYDSLACCRQCSGLEEVLINVTKSSYSIVNFVIMKPVEVRHVTIYTSFKDDPVASITLKMTALSL